MNINPFKTNLQFLIHTKTNKINSQLINDYMNIVIHVTTHPNWMMLGRQYVNKPKKAYPNR